MANKIHIRPNLFLPGEDTLFHHAENKLQSDWVQLTTTAGHSAATSYPQQASFSCETRKRKYHAKIKYHASISCSTNFCISYYL